MKIEVTQVKFQAASPLDAEGGLLGWTSFVLNGAVLIKGVTVRKSAENRYYLSFPEQRASGRRRSFFVRPLDDRARRDIEHQVLRALGYLQEAQR